MQQKSLLLNMRDRIENMKALIGELKRLSNGVAAVDCNLTRIAACVDMLEINISDLQDIME